MDRAAVSIDPPVPQRREEGAYKHVAVSSVQFHPVTARFTGPPGRIAELFDDFFDFFDGQFTTLLFGCVT